LFSGEALRREIAERAVGPLGVVVLTEVFDHDVSLGERLKLLTVESFIAEAGVWNDSTKPFSHGLAGVM
jgi:hypothetical protein